MVDHATSLIGRRLLRVAEQGLESKSPGLLSLARLQPALDMIQGTLTEDFTLAELARACHSSVFHFARSFSARMGLAPFQFQRKLRLQRAQDLLLKTQTSVEGVGFAVGIQNASHFSRLFRGEFGCSPSEYRRRMLKPKS